MRRRRLLTSVGVALTGGLAGCSGGGEEGTETEGGTATATPTPTPTATATPTPTPTEAAAPSAPTHGLDETFTVGEGESAIRYTFERFFRAQELGRLSTEEANDTYLIVVLTVENPGEETITVPSPRIKLRGSGVIKNVDESASEAVGSDRRLDLESIAAATITPGGSAQGVIVYDAPTGVDYRIEVAPTDPDAGTAHYVTVGDLADVEELQGSGY